MFNLVTPIWDAEKDPELLAKLCPDFIWELQSKTMSVDIGKLLKKNSFVKHLEEQKGPFKENLLTMVKIMNRCL